MRTVNSPMIAGGIVERMQRRDKKIKGSDRKARG